MTTASRMRFCAATRIGIGRRVIGGRARPHHQAFGIVRGQEIAAGVVVCVMTVECALPRQGALDDTADSPVAS